MPRRKTPFPVKYRNEEKLQSKRCVYKIWADDEFMVWKGLSLTQSVTQVSEQIHRNLSRAPGSAGLFEKLMRHIENHRNLFVEIELLHCDSNALEMLKAEYNLLQESKNNPRCLNVSFEPHIPQWIPVLELEDYEKWRQLQTTKTENNG